MTVARGASAPVVTQLHAGRTGVLFPSKCEPGKSCCGISPHREWNAASIRRPACLLQFKCGKNHQCSVTSEVVHERVLALLNTVVQNRSGMSDNCFVRTSTKLSPSQSRTTHLLPYSTVPTCTYFGVTVDSDLKPVFMGLQHRWDLLSYSTEFELQCRALPPHVLHRTLLGRLSLLLP